MEALAALFVGKPLIIAAVGLAFLIAYFVWHSMQPDSDRNPRALFLAAGAWLAYAAWEGFVMWRTPEADIRVDLLLIWPIVAILTVVSLYRAIRRRK